MSKVTLIATLMAVVSAFSSPAKAQVPLKTKSPAKSDQLMYVITAHAVVHDDSTNSQLDNYVIVYGSEVLKVQYAESQISTVKPGASELEQVAPGKNLHLHTRYGRWPQEPDVSQVPQVGVPIRACEMDTKYPDNDGHPVIAIQSVSAPCMSRDGDTLHYVIAPNGGIKMWEYVNFDILEATNNVGVAAAQSAPPRKDIPAIAKAANGAIVSVIMSDKDGSPIAQGSGFFVSSDGVILTNYHVIAEGSSAVVKFPDGAFYVVDGVLASDKKRDIAVIKAHGQNFRTLPLGNSDRVQVGEEVVAIGNPLSLESTVSNGIVSGIRAVEEEGGKYLQITAPISPGSSGGPLFDMAGEVIGITTMYLKGGENLNFAIPINDAKSLLLAKSSKIQALPNEPEPVHAETRDGNTPPPVAAPAAKTNPSARDYYQQLYDAGGLSGDYVCFSDNSPGGTLTSTPDQFFTFEAWAYDQSYYDAFDRLETLRTSSMPGATNKEKMAAFLARGQTQLTPEEQTQVDIMKRVERTNLPYLRFFFREWLGVFSPEDQRFYRSGGRSLFEYFYDKGVNISTNVFHWAGNSWVQSIPPTDPNAYVRESYIERLIIEPTTMRYANSVTLTKTAGSGETATTVTRDYDASGGVCEKIPTKQSN